MTTVHALSVEAETPLHVRLYLARKAAGLGVEEVSQRLGVSGSTWEKTEAGARQPRRSELLAFAQITGQDPAFFGASLDSSEPPNLSPLADAVKPEPKAAA